MSVLKYEINRMEEAIGRQLSLRRRFNHLIALQGGGAGCTPSKRSEYHKPSRKSPLIPANECEAGTVKEGNDKRMYMVKPNKNNVNRWVLQAKPVATPSHTPSGMGSVAQQINSPRETKPSTADAEKETMQKEMAAMRAKIKQLEQQLNIANKVMDDHEVALLTKHLDELRQQTGSNHSGKFAKDLAFGTSKDALNLAAFLGMSEEYTREVNRNGEAMMKRQIEALQTTGRLPNDPSWWFDRNSDEVIEHWNYVVHETSSEKQYPNGIRDEGRPPTNLEDFMKMPQAIKAKLSRSQVIALRLYTTSIYSYVNEPLRNNKLYRTFPDQPNQPTHPLSAVVWYIFTGLKQLREVVDMKQGERIVLWRGMTNVSCVPSTFMENGGAEPAPMSTSRDMKVALNYGTDGSSMDGSVLFKIIVRNDLEMGADIQWLSAFPQEAEVLYPPLALLIPSKKEIKVLDGGGGVSSSSINIIEMTANLSSGLGLVVGESMCVEDKIHI